MATPKFSPYSAPKFTLPDESGTLHSLEEYRGSWLVLYFYPKDDTPGCTTQACSLRDERDTLMEHDTQVVGVSMDAPDAHEAFKARHSLNFTLLSDPDGITIRDYGAWGPKMFGREGILRKTFIIDPAGIVRKVYGRATPAGHGDKVLQDILALQSR